MTAPDWLRRAATVLVLVSTVLACTVAAIDRAGAAREDYPRRPVRIPVPSGAGGVGDLTIRLLANKLSQNLKQPFIIENRPGAGGIAAMRTVLGAPADGHARRDGKRAVDQHEPVPGPALRRAQ